MAGKLGLKKLLGPDCAERDLAYALVLSRAVRPKSKLATGSGLATLQALPWALGPLPSSPLAAATDVMLVGSVS